MRVLVPLGRVLFAIIFMRAAFAHFASGTIDAAAAHGVPVATLVVPLSGILAGVGGLLIALGFHARLGALMVVAFLVPVTLVMHRFWDLADPQLAAMQEAMFWKNTSMLGAALLILYWGAGPFGLDRPRRLAL